MYIHKSICIYISIYTYIYIYTHTHANTTDPAGLVVDPHTGEPVELCAGGAGRRLVAEEAVLREVNKSTVGSLHQIYCIKWQ